MGSFDGWTYGEQMSPETTGAYTRFACLLKLRPGRSEKHCALQCANTVHASLLVVIAHVAHQKMHALMPVCADSISSFTRADMKSSSLLMESGELLPSGQLSATECWRTMCW